eukprot:9178871-Alexandrium_andersonii.AAC.1
MRGGSSSLSTSPAIRPWLVVCKRRLRVAACKLRESKRRNVWNRVVCGRCKTACCVSWLGVLRQ